MASLQGLVAECPTCKAVVAIDAPECPQCGELFETESPTGATASPSTASAEDSANDDDEVKERTGFREKFLFYIGIFLILLGGPGIALGSWLHDMLRISVGEFTAFDAFGPWNRLVTAIGLIVLIVGIVCLILSLRFSRPSDVEKDLNALRQS
ncbi:MAG: hypothetical protein E6J97_03335 [Methanobacteriota archaeon]|nr:MAG: hypothetical protein E6J97_03335 [Euryarchaeota archaeon]